MVVTGEGEEKGWGDVMSLARVVSLVLSLREATHVSVIIFCLGWTMSRSYLTPYQLPVTPPQSPIFWSRSQIAFYDQHSIWYVLWNLSWVILVQVDTEFRIPKICDGSQYLITNTPYPYGSSPSQYSDWRISCGPWWSHIKPVQVICPKMVMLSLGPSVHSPQEYL